MIRGAEREAERQQLLLRTLWRDAPATALQGWLREERHSANSAGLAAYRANAGAIAERALVGAFPTVAALIGGDSFAGLARDFWQQHPPVRGDLGEWGAALPAFIAVNALLAGEPYLADSARLDWLVHQASRATDMPDEAPALDALAQHAPEDLHLLLRPGCAVLASQWPIAAIWQAHQRQGDDRFATVREAFAASRADTAFIWRDGFFVRVDALGAEVAAFNAAVLRGESLAAALNVAGEDFAFDHWLVQALQQRWLVAVQTHPSPNSP